MESYLTAHAFPNFRTSIIKMRTAAPKWHFLIPVAPIPHTIIKFSADRILNIRIFRTVLAGSITPTSTNTTVN